MINIHLEVAGAGGTSGAWARTDDAAARSARRLAEEGLRPSEGEAFGAAALLCAAVRRERACDRRLGLPRGRVVQMACPVARAACLVCVRAYARWRTRWVAIAQLFWLIAFHNDRKDSEMCARISVEKSAVEV